MADYNVVYEPSDDTYLMMDGLSYDFNTSPLRGATKSVGAVEISIVYVHNKKEMGEIDYGKFCPNF